MLSFYKEKTRTTSKHNSSIINEKFISEMSLSHLTTHFLFYVIKESLVLIKKAESFVQDEKKEDDLDI